MRVNEWKNKRVLCAIVNECQKTLENGRASEKKKRRRHTKEYETKNVSKRPNTRHSEYKFFFLFVSLSPFCYDGALSLLLLYIGTGYHSSTEIIVSLSIQSVLYMKIYTNVETN